MTSSFVPPAHAIVRAMTSDQTSMSFLVYPTTVGLPVVPEEAWISATSDIGTANIPNG